MKRISRRARACAGSRPPERSRSPATASAQATFPEKTGDGVPTGQASIQMFN